jgi:hypothetical protein
MIFTHRQISFKYQIKENEMGGACSTHEGERELHTGFWRGDKRERGSLEDLGVDGKIILKWIFKEEEGRTWTGLICLKIDML